jgi:hypothetical protein
MTLEYKASCFADMPFGKKPDLAGGVVFDSHVVYELATKPAINEAGLEPIQREQRENGRYHSSPDVCANTTGRVHG